jgi:hypothetical protein
MLKAKKHSLFDNENIVFQGSAVFCLQPVVLGFHSMLVLRNYLILVHQPSTHYKLNVHIN